MSKVIIFPTDTVYGIGTPIFDTKGIDKIYEIKKRSKDKPLACLFSNINRFNPNITRGSIIMPSIHIIL